MQRTNAQSTIVPDAMAIIAACTGSRALMELAVALRAIVTGAVSLPPDRAETILRIAGDLTNPHWNVQAHVTLKDPRIQYYAKAFCRACIQTVPLTPENPIRDLVWQGRVKAALEQHASLQNHAKLLLQNIRLRVTPPQQAVAPVATANPTPRKRDKAELHTKAKQFAEELVRRHQAQKAQTAANAPSAATSAPELAQPTEPAQANDCPSVPEPAAAPRRRRIFRNVARYASMPLDQISPGFS